VTLKKTDAARCISDMVQARGVEYERTLEGRRERKREQECIRKREARQRQTPDQRERERVRKRKARPLLTLEQKEREREQRRSRKKLRPFMAVDGEGGGTDELGRQNYLHMHAANSEEEYLFNRQGAPLSTRDCLEFLLSLPARPILVGYGVGYDASQILRGIKTSTLRKIMNPRQGKNGPRYEYWGEYAIIYQQGQYLRVARIDRGGPKAAIVKGSCRTVYETIGFFQCAFVKAITDWKIGSQAERDIISENKSHRDTFSKLTKGIIEYCKLECRHLAMLMEELRNVCTATGILPKQWSGAGWLASALLDKHDVPKRPLTSTEIAALAEKQPTKNSSPIRLRRPERDPKFEIATNKGYYGGRFEVSNVGLLDGPIYEYDIRSAYPAAMLDLPCQLHTRWEHKPRGRRLPDSGIYLANVSFSFPDGLWCGLPFRQKGGLFWPFRGTGWYWSIEIEAARRFLGANFIVHDLWIARCECNCRPFDWVRELYEERRRIGPNTLGYPLKLGLNSLYGKLAQRCGRGPYHDVVSAGLITALTRERLLEAIGQDPEAVVMLATDAVFSKRPLALDVGEDLGQWERKQWDNLFIAQPGVYWSPSKLSKLVKSRGAPRSVIGEAAPRFAEVWNEWHALMRQPGARELILAERQIPSVPVTVRVFNGCRIALHRGKPWLAGKWEDVQRYESFEWRTKRDPNRINVSDEGHIVTFPRVQSIFAESEGYKPADFDRLIEISGENGGPVEIDENMLLEAMPDHTPFLPHE
jgi:DNA polymerase type B, organellar and viral